MDEAALNARGFFFEGNYGRGDEPGGTGCIIAFYKANDARYAGVSLNWNRQPIVRDPFPTKAAAIEAARSAQQPF